MHPRDSVDGLSMQRIAAMSLGSGMRRQNEARGDEGAGARPRVHASDEDSHSGSIIPPAAPGGRPLHLALPT
ncbi:hypothetical protein EVAR_74736_1 [Eumeta japonica]|uniref:Uncharacterized protein n=1 Tax=Eumeta variegata TaxID=151549 RepID=A0A4C1SP56_EUMVA|nr:hypothetical protein EVAR_74736_1 [Eumeta japonica]